MSPAGALLAFTAAATLLTLTPGLDTALVLRTAAAEGARRAMLAALGISLGCVTWGMLIGSGLGALLATAPTAFAVLRWAGALYLAWLGLKLLLHPRAVLETAADGARSGGSNPLARGLLTNLLNPKVGLFYLSFLPQFIPAGSNAALWSVLLTALHGLIGFAWFAVLVGAARSLGRSLARPGAVAWLDRASGALFLGFALRLALNSRA